MASRGIRLVLAAATVAAIVLAALLLRRMTYNSIVFPATMVVAAAILILYAPLAWKALTTTSYADRHRLGFGIFLTWTSLLGIFVWSVIGALNGFTVRMTESTVTQVLFAFTGIGGLLHIRAVAQSAKKTFIVLAAIFAVSLVGTFVYVEYRHISRQVVP